MVDLGFEATKHEPECKPELKPKKLFSRKIWKYLNKQVLSVCGVCVCIDSEKSRMVPEVPQPYVCPGLRETDLVGHSSQQHEGRQRG